MLQLHWTPKSPFVRKVMICIHELGMDAEIGKIRSVAAMLKPNAALMQDNPLSKIPTLLLEDGSALFDSVVICEYLNDLAGGTLFPASGEAKWQALRWHALGDGFLDALILWRNERERAQPLKPLMDAFELKAAAVLAQLDREAAALEKAPFTIGSVTIACAVGYMDFRYQDYGWREKAPALARWFAGVSARPSMQATVAVEG